MSDYNPELHHGDHHEEIERWVNRLREVVEHHDKHASGEWPLGTECGAIVGARVVLAANPKTEED